MARAKAQKTTKHRTRPVPLILPVGEAEGPPPIDPGPLRVKALDELLKLIVDGTVTPEGRTASVPGKSKLFLLSPRVIAALVDDDDGTLPPQPAEHLFARSLLHFGLFGVMCLGLSWRDAIAGCLELAMGRRLPTVEEITALRGKAAVAAGR